MVEDAAASEAARYVVVARPSPGLATIAERRDGTTRLWSRSLGGGQGNCRDRRCVACGGSLRGGFYRPPQIRPPRDERLCLACVEGVER